MKRILITIFLFIFIAANAVNFYIKTGGNYAYTSLSNAQAWATITKVNSSFSQLTAGDSILFNRGDTFTGTITVAHSGSIGNPIVIGAYGIGDNPIITGFTMITGWINVGGGIYSKAVTCASLPNMVTVDGVNTSMGRWPNTGWRTISSCPNTTTITDATLPSSPNWDGAKVVIRKNHWTIDCNTISKHSGTTITYANASSFNAIVGYGYFIQNDIKTLDILGEWYYNSVTSTFYMFFGVVDPTTKTVKVATLDKIISNMASPYYSYITLDNLNLQGANTRIVDIRSSSYFTIQDCEIGYSGEFGIYGYSNSGTNANYFTLKNSTITECNNTPMYIASRFPEVSIRRIRQAVPLPMERGRSI